jgi:hypothetical protein
LIPPGWKPDRMFRALACDGPHNGQYITAREAWEASVFVDGVKIRSYVLDRWLSDEYDEWIYVYRHEDIDPDLAQYINDAVMECELR